MGLTCCLFRRPTNKNDSVIKTVFASDKKALISRQSFGRINSRVIVLIELSVIRITIYFIWVYVRRALGIPVLDTNHIKRAH